MESVCVTHSEQLLGLKLSVTKARFSFKLSCRVTTQLDQVLRAPENPAKGWTDFEGVVEHFFDEAYENKISIQDFQGLKLSMSHTPEFSRTKRRPRKNNKNGIGKFRLSLTLFDPDISFGLYGGLGEMICSSHDTT